MEKSYSHNPSTHWNDQLLIIGDWHHQPVSDPGRIRMAIGATSQLGIRVDGLFYTFTALRSSSNLAPVPFLISDRPVH